MPTPPPSGGLPAMPEDLLALIQEGASGELASRKRYTGPLARHTIWGKVTPSLARVVQEGPEPSRVSTSWLGEDIRKSLPTEVPPGYWDVPQLTPREQAYLRQLIPDMMQRAKDEYEIEQLRRQRGTK